MSIFRESLTETVSKHNSKGGVPSRIDSEMIPALEAMNDGSLDDFLEALQDPSVTHPLMARSINNMFKGMGMDLSIQSGAVRKYRKRNYPEIFGPLTEADIKYGR